MSLESLDSSEIVKVSSEESEHPSKGDGPVPYLANRKVIEEYSEDYI